MTAYDIIRKPVLSEKGFAGIEGKRYTFFVAMNATKTQIKAAIEEIYDGVVVERVNTARYRGKVKRQGKYSGLTPSYKKAIVQLKAKSKGISAFESLQ